MSDSGLGFGGFLVGLGLGWYLFQYIDLGFEALSYLLILMGVGMILSGLLSKGNRQHPISGIYGGVIGGLFLAVFLTQGFNFVFDITDQFTELSDAPYRVTQGFTMNTPVTSEVLEFDVVSVNGGIDVYTWSGDTVKWEIDVKAKGDSNSEAEALLDEFEYTLTDELVSGVQEISLSFPLSSSEWSNYAVLIDLYVPSGLESSYSLDTTNGEISLTDIICINLETKTTNGGIKLNNIESERIISQTTNGVIFGTINTPESRMQTTNGAIELSLQTLSGTHEYFTTNGLIELNTPTGSDVGYSVNFDTSIGALDINLPNMDYDVDTARTKIGESSDYDTKPIKIEITAETTIGGIDVN